MRQRFSIKKSQKIPKWSLETLNQRTDNTEAKKKKKDNMTSQKTKD